MRLNRSLDDFGIKKWAVTEENHNGAGGPNVGNGLSGCMSGTKLLLLYHPPVHTFFT